MQKTPDCEYLKQQQQQQQISPTQTLAVYFFSFAREKKIPRWIFFILNKSKPSRPVKNNHSNETAIEF
jgi:hypothetical protein